MTIERIYISIVCLLVLSVNAGLAVSECGFSKRFEPIGYVATKELEILWRDDISGKIEQSRREPFVILCAEGVIHNRPVFVYVIKTGDFFDFVFFPEERTLQDVLSYFIQRWSYIADGIMKGFIHFNEDYIDKFIEEEDFANYFSDYIDIHRMGSEHGNQIFNSLRARLLKSYVSIATGILEVINESQSEPIRQP